MKFYKKLTLAFFLLSFAIISTICLVLYLYLSQFIKSEMIKNYNNELSQLADTFVELEQATEIIGINALKSLKMIEQISGLPSNQQLIKFANDLSINDIYIANASGSFIRSTNGPINANIFSYCGDYVNLINGKADLFVTPVVPSSDEPTMGFNKYIMIPNADRSKILEASIAFNFIVKFLHSSLKNNHDILSISLYTPTGLLLGSVSRDEAAKDIHGETMHIIKSFEDNSKNCCECKVKRITNGENTYYYKLVASVSTKKITKSIRYLSINIFIIFIFSTLIFIFISRFLSNYLVARFQELHKKINRMIDYDEIKSGLNMTGRDEIADVANQFDKLLNKFNENKKQLISAEKDKAIAAVAAQLAHDVRSPLVALDLVIKDIANIPEEQRIMIRNSTSRIYDIANNLLANYKDKSLDISDVSYKKSSELIADLVLSVVSEKRSQYKNHPIDFLITIDNTSRSAFSNISPSEFKRVISNLLNNSVEALECKSRETIGIELLSQSGCVALTINDHGCGISPDLLQKIITGVGETRKKNGNGLGLPHAIRMVEEEWGGQFVIQSHPNEGTKIEIILKQTQTPDWFASELAILPNTKIVILDDDESIHQVWRKRIEEISTNVEFVDFYNPLDLISKCQHKMVANILYLIDFELIGSVMTGFDVINALYIAQNSYLVTSRYEDLAIREQCTRVGVRIIPKKFAPHIPIRVIKMENIIYDNADFDI